MDTSNKDIKQQRRASLVRCKGQNQLG